MQAFMFAVQQQPDVILLDINMPAGTGHGAICVGGTTGVPSDNLDSRQERAPWERRPGQDADIFAAYRQAIDEKCAQPSAAASDHDHGVCAAVISRLA